MRLFQLVFFLCFGLVAGAAIENYAEIQRTQAILAVYLSLSPSALSDIKI